MASTYHSTTLVAPDQTARGTIHATLGRLIDRVPRLVRFGAVGATCALFQLFFLGQLVHRGAELHLANTAAFIVSTQLNFVLSSLITWRDRFASRPSLAQLCKRLAGYNMLALASLAINQAIFALALPFTNYLVAAVLGILVGMILNYAMSGRVIFRRLGRAPHAVVA